MPANTTAKALPYPLGTDRLMDGDDSIRKLAQSVDNMTQGGQARLNIVTGGTAVSVAITFPTAYASPPTLAATPIAGTAATNIAVSVTSITATGFTLSGVRASAGAQDVQWIAVGPVAPVA